MRRAWLLAAALSWAACRGGGPAAGSLPTASLSFADKTTMRVELALDPADREKGLMDRTSLPADYGMLFVFPREQVLQFWMKNTFVDLDMVFIGADRRVTVVHAGVPRSAFDTPEANVARRTGVGQYVLELPSGAAARRGLAPGQAVVFGSPIQVPER